MTQRQSDEENRMHFEQKRLETFRNWPQNSLIEPNKLAKAGFYYLGKGTSVKCFSCKLGISHWKPEDKAIVRHKELNPNCDFILNKSNNVISLMNSTSLPPSLQDQPSVSVIKPMYSQKPQRAASQKVWTKFSDLMDESERLKTFAGWNVHFININDLAAAGFFYLKERDLVQCFYCDGRIEGWEGNDIPMEEHKRHFPKCPVVVGITGTEIQESPVTSDHKVLHHLDHIGLQLPKYAKLEERLRSFSEWPSSIPQQPQNLANAGFYYTGISDHVRCFSCDGGLRNWEEGDDCWREHARSFGGCKFLLKEKGQAFVDEVNRSDLPKTSQNAETVRQDVTSMKLKPAKQVETSTKPASGSQDSSLHSAPTIYKLQVAGEKVENPTEEAMDYEYSSPQSKSFESSAKLQASGKKQVETSTKPASGSPDSSLLSESTTPIYKVQAAGEKQVKNLKKPTSVSQDASLLSEPSTIYKLHAAEGKVE